MYVGFFFVWVLGEKGGGGGVLLREGLKKMVYSPKMSTADSCLVVEASKAWVVVVVFKERRRA